MSYARQTWVDGSAGGTPLSAARLNVIEAGLETESKRQVRYVTALTDAAGAASAETVRGTLVIAAQGYAYTICPAAYWSGLNADDAGVYAFRIREDSVTGAIVATSRQNLPLASRGNFAITGAGSIAIASGGKTLVATSLRITGTGTIATTENGHISAFLIPTPDAP